METGPWRLVHGDCSLETGMRLLVKWRANPGNVAVLYITARCSRCSSQLGLWDISNLLMHG